MIHDAQALFSDAQSLTGSASVVSTNVMDLGIARDIGTGQPLFLVVTVDVVFSVGGITVDVVLQGGASAGTVTGTRTLFRIPSVAAAGSVFGARLSPAGLGATGVLNSTDPLAYRFIQLTYTVNGGTLTTGTVTAFLTTQMQQVPSYATGIVVA